MLQVAAPIWNEIARTQKLKTAWARKTFPMTSEQMMQEHEREGAELRQRGEEPTVIVSYLETKPLLLENMAISRYLLQANRPELRDAMPEVTTPSEAVLLICSGRPLKPSQQQRLLTLLQKAQS